MIVPFISNCTGNNTQNKEMYIKLKTSAYQIKIEQTEEKLKNCKKTAGISAERQKMKAIQKLHPKMYPDLV